MAQFELEKTRTPVEATRACSLTKFGGTDLCAERGDWIVTTAMGATFPVADMVFRAEYAPVDAAARRALREELPEEGAV